MVSGFDFLNQSIDLSDIQPLKQWPDDVLPGVLFDTVKDQLNEQVLDLHVTAGAFAAVKVDGQVITWGGPRQHGGRKTHGKAAEHVFFPRKDRDLSRLIWDGIWLGYSGRRLGIIWDMYKFWVNHLYFLIFPIRNPQFERGVFLGTHFIFWDYLPRTSKIWPVAEFLETVIEFLTDLPSNYWTLCHGKIDDLWWSAYQTWWISIAPDLWIPMSTGIYPTKWELSTRSLYEHVMIIRYWWDEHLKHVYVNGLLYLWLIYVRLFYGIVVLCMVLIGILPRKIGYNIQPFFWGYSMRYGAKYQQLKWGKIYAVYTAKTFRFQFQTSLSKKLL